MTLDFYLIRHKPTGFYLPQPEGWNGRGGSWVEPTSADEKRPRLFMSELAAKRGLGQWLRGRHSKDGYADWESGHYEDCGVAIEPVASRKREEMEIVCVRVELP